MFKHLDPLNVLHWRRSSAMYGFWNYDQCAGIYQGRLHRKVDYYEYAGRNIFGGTTYELHIVWQA